MSLAILKIYKQPGLFKNIGKVVALVFGNSMRAEVNQTTYRNQLNHVYYHDTKSNPTSSMPHIYLVQPELEYIPSPDTTPAPPDLAVRGLLDFTVYLMRL